MLAQICLKITEKKVSFFFFFTGPYIHWTSVKLEVVSSGKYILHGICVYVCSRNMHCLHALFWVYSAGQL